jgi:hypothetical protein
LIGLGAVVPSHPFDKQTFFHQYLEPPWRAVGQSALSPGGKRIGALSSGIVAYSKAKCFLRAGKTGDSRVRWNDLPHILDELLNGEDGLQQAYTVTDLKQPIFPRTFHIQRKAREFGRSPQNAVACTRLKWRSLLLPD